MEDVHVLIQSYGTKRLIKNEDGLDTWVQESKYITSNSSGSEPQYETMMQHNFFEPKGERLELTAKS